jgi:hypothetical protein
MQKRTPLRFDLASAQVVDEAAGGGDDDLPALLERLICGL